MNLRLALFRAALDDDPVADRRQVFRAARKVTQTSRRLRLGLARRRVEHKDAAVLQEDAPRLEPFSSEGRELRREEIRPAVIFKTQSHSPVQG